MFPLLRLLLAATLALFISASLSLAAENIFGPFSVSASAPNVIVLNGEIDIGSALNFRRALQAAPNAKLLTLNSPGGTVQMALLIADDVHERGISTYIARDSGCHSACALIFLAGVERQADGALGVHQISSETGDLVSAQLSISDILEVLNRFDTPMEVMTTMFKTPPNDMHVFTADEIARYRINRKRGDPVSAGSQPLTSITPNPDATTITVKPTDSHPSPGGQVPGSSDQAIANLSAMEDYATALPHGTLYRPRSVRR